MICIQRKMVPLRLVGKKLIKKCIILMNQEFFNVINGLIIIMLDSMVKWLKIYGSRIVM